jgi:DNA-3-methyladenine glycosylase II
MPTPRIARARRRSRAQSNQTSAKSIVAKRARKAPGSPAADKTSGTAKAARIIVGEADIRAGVRALVRKCSTMRQVHEVAGAPPLRRRPAGFEGLARIIVGQQLSVASASAIWERTVAACQPFEPGTMLGLSDGELAQAGLSRPKIRTLRGIAGACQNGLDLARLDEAAEEEVHAALTEVTGIGPWTADIYIMFCLGRADAWAPGDLALQIATQQALGLAERPGSEAMREIAERWRPWRAVAARLLWAYYAAVKRRKAVPV